LYQINVVEVMKSKTNESQNEQNILLPPCVRWSLKEWRSRSTPTCEVVGTSSTELWSSFRWSTSSSRSPHQPVLASSASSVSSGCCAPSNRSGLHGHPYCLCSLFKVN